MVLGKERVGGGGVREGGGRASVGHDEWDMYFQDLRVGDHCNTNWIELARYRWSRRRQLHRTVAMSTKGKSENTEPMLSK